MVWWGILSPVVAIAAVIYGITTHRRWVWAIAGAYVVVSLLLFLFLGGIGSILRGSGSISGCTSAGGSGTGPELLALLCQRRIRAGNGAVELLGANVPDSRRLIACSRLGVAPVGRVDP